MRQNSQFGDGEKMLNKYVYIVLLCTVIISLFIERFDESFFSPLKNIIDYISIPIVIFLIPLVNPISQFILFFISLYFIYKMIFHVGILSKFEKIFMVLILIITPLLSFLLSTIAFTSAYKYEKGDNWLYYINDYPASFMWIPFYIISSVFIYKSILNINFLYKYRNILIVMLITLISICIWYVISIIKFNLTKGAFGDEIFLLSIPAISALFYIGFLIYVFNKKNKNTYNNILYIFSWLFSFIISTLAKYPLAQNIYLYLPENPPKGYGDCFIVSASTKGHSILIGKVKMPNGKYIFRQLFIFKFFEKILEVYFTKSHNLLRKIYNKVAPKISSKIKTKIQADIVYIILLIIELFLYIIIFLLLKIITYNDRKKGNRTE